ncbi:MAG: hypothetical protein SOH81_08065 [Acetobacter sp.]|jgi:hypothetical protein
MTRMAWSDPSLLVTGTVAGDLIPILRPVVDGTTGKTTYQPKSILVSDMVASEIYNALATLMATLPTEASAGKLWLNALALSLGTGDVAGESGALVTIQALTESLLRLTNALPVEDPHVSGAAWNNAGSIVISEG